MSIGRRRTSELGYPHSMFTEAGHHVSHFVCADNTMAGCSAGYNIPKRFRG